MPFKKNRQRSLLRIRREKRKGALCLISLCKDKKHVTKHPTQLTYHFHQQTTKPLGPSSTPGCDAYIHLQVVLTTFGDKKTNGAVHLVSTWISLKSMIIKVFSVIEIFMFPKSKLVPYQPDLSIKVNSASLQLLQDHQVWLVHNVPMLVGGVCPRQSPPL